jgi:hypothetical protein
VMSSDCQQRPLARRCPPAYGFLRDSSLNLVLTRALAKAKVCDNEVAPVAKRIIANFILFLCIGVMNRELPECMALRDDVSNDGDVAIYNLRLPQSVSVLASTLDAQAASASHTGSFPVLLQRGRASRLPAPIPHDGVGLLRLIDQQRC